MAVFRALGSPLRIGAATDIFDLIERVLNVGIEIGAGIDVLLHHGIPGVNGENGLHVEVFAPFEKFEQSHAVGRVVVPGAGVRGAINHRPNRLLPLKALGDVVAFEIVAAGKAQEVRVHSGQLFHQVDTKAVGTVVVGRWKEGGEIKPEISGLIDGDEKMVVCSRRHASGAQHEFVLLPVATDTGHDRLTGGLSCVVVDQPDGDRSGAVGVRVEGALVFGVGLNEDAPVASVLDAGATGCVGAIYDQLEAIGQGS